MRARRAGFLHPAYRAAFTKTGIIESFASGFQVILTTEVYEEQVTAGLKRNLADAKQMKKFVSDGMITVAKKGEITIWQMTLILLYHEAFLKVLDANGSPFIPVAGVILMCMQKGTIAS